MAFLAKIVGFVLIIYGTVSVLFAILSYRTLRTGETSFYLVSITSSFPDDAGENEFGGDSAPISQEKFIRVFMLPAIFILIVGLVTVILAYRHGPPRELSQVSNTSKSRQ